MDGQVGYWIRAALEEASYDNEEDEEVVQEITNTLKGEKVKGAALLLLTSGDMKDMKIPVGPCKVLANRIAAVSQPTAKAGFCLDFLGSGSLSSNRNLASLSCLHCGLPHQGVGGAFGAEGSWLLQVHTHEA